MAKRRFISQLPAINQTETLQKFFRPTIDQLFQPGETQSINAFVGKKPSYYNPATDFYKPEINAERAFYQLEPAMTARTAISNAAASTTSTTFSNLLFYQDLANNLRFHGGNVTNHERLYQTEFYSWCPPINIKKLVNYREYYWLPDGPPVMSWNIEATTFTGNGTNPAIALPAALVGMVEDVVVTVNGTAINAGLYVVDNTLHTVQLNFTPQNGDVVKVWTNGNFTQNVIGKSSFQFSGEAQSRASTIEQVQSLHEVVDQWEDKVWEKVDGDPWEFIQALQSQNTVINYGPAVMANNPVLVADMRIEITDNTGTHQYIVQFVDDVIALNPVTTHQVTDEDDMGNPVQHTVVDNNLIRCDPYYWTIERNAPTENLWSRTNHWYHKSVLTYQDSTYAPAQAQRPIIEFFRDMVLWNTGTHSIQNVDYIYDASSTDTSLNYNGQTLTSLYGIREENSVFQEDKRILVASSTETTWNTKILETSLDSEYDYWDTVGFDTRNYDDNTDVINFHPVYTPTAYDQVGIVDDPVFVNEDIAAQPNDVIWTELTLQEGVQQREYWFDGTTWKASQAFAFQAPLFQLFDSLGISVSDTTKYPNSSFTGNKVFAYQISNTGATVDDTVLGIPAVRNTYGQFQYVDHTSTDNNNAAFESADTITWGTNTAIPQPISGYRYYGFVGREMGDSLYQEDFTYSSNWHYAGLTQQEQSTEGFWEIPLNLQANPLNDEITTISANDWTAHFNQLLQGSDWTRDSRSVALNTGKDIVQNVESLVKNMLLNSTTSTDFIRAVAYVEREYLRYRNKFAQFITRLYQSEGIDDVDTAISRALNQLKIARTPDFPFYNTGMAAQPGDVDDWYMPASGAYLGMTGLWEPEYLIAYTATQSIIQIKGHDGSILTGKTIYQGTEIRINSSGVPVNALNEVQEINPQDAVMLRFEQIIYMSADVKLQTQRRNDFDILSIMEGKFRTGLYTRAETLAIARPMFDRWASGANVNYLENKIYDENNRFTWNYSQNVDRDGEYLPGYWRGMYKWYLDTDRPHTHPWEMLGWTFKPAWWDAAYSWTDSGKRAALILAIEQGLVSDPQDTANLTYDSTFARADIGNRIPVDNAGILLDPISANFVVDTGVYNYNSDWQWGDGAPLENGWWTSQYTSFIFAQLSYLMQPVKFMGNTWASLDTTIVNDEQQVLKSTWKRSVPAMLRVHNEVSTTVNGGLPVRILGMQVWISDYIKSLGQDITATLGTPLRAVDVNLANKLGGFCDPATIKTFTENFGLIPEENVNTALYRSPSIREEFYGGLIVEWTGNGWKVYGYDTIDPNFHILPVKETGTRVKITLAGSTESTPYDWHPDTYYMVNTKVVYANTQYVCNKTHTSGTSFEQEFWTASPAAAASPSGSVLYYLKNESTDQMQSIPYGTVLGTRQDVANLISGYSAYLVSRGWVFDEYDSDTNTVKDWEQSTREFLVWSSTGWTAGSFIALSPSALNVKFNSTYGTINNIEQLVNGTYSVLSREGAALSSNNLDVNRSDNQIVVSTNMTGNGIYGLRVFLSEIEHVIVFDNSTIFQNVIYDPLYNIRQNRIRLIALTSTNWVGRLDAPGFIVTDNLLVPSFDRQVEDIRYTYDIETPIKLPLRDAAMHQIGYQSRTYLENIMFNEINQFEFYQGMIQMKGTPSVYSKLMRSSELTQTRDMAFLEEWAIRTGTFGGIDAVSEFEFELSKDQIKSDPQLIEFKNIGFWDIKNWDEFQWGDSVTREELSAMDSTEDTVITLYESGDVADSRWVTVPDKNDIFFPEEVSYIRKAGWLPNAGYTRLLETTWQALTFDTLINQLTDYPEDLVVGDTAWIYTNGDSTWGVYAVDNMSTDNFANNFANTVNGMEITFDNPVLANVGDYVYLTKEVLNDIQTTGFYPILSIDAVTNTILVEAESIADREYAEDETRPTIFRLYNKRIILPFINNATDIGNKKTAIIQNTISVSDLTTLAGSSGIALPSAGSFIEGSLVYVDFMYELTTQNSSTLMTDSDKRWAVFQYSETSHQFELFRTQPENIRRDMIEDIRLFDLTPRRDDTTLNDKPLLYSDILVYAPTQGIIPGVADREIWYKVEVDPASYNVSPTPAFGYEWGADQVGRLWWDLSSTRYMLAETDMLTDEEEKYRKDNWGKLAPDSSVDIYEWVASSVTPDVWESNFINSTDTNVWDGSVLYTDRYVQSTVWDNTLGKDVAVYYFWVKNRTSIPAYPNVNDKGNIRQTSAASVSEILTNPSAAGLVWMAPLTASSMIISGIAPFTNSTTSLNIRINEVEFDAPKHVEWQIMRAGDERSLPDRTLWTKICWSLSARNQYGAALPDTNLYASKRVGYDVERGQNMFSNVTGARKHLVQSVNKILSGILVSDTRRSPIVLNGGEGTADYLIWNQKINSFYLEPYPVGSAQLTNNNGLWDARFGNINDMTQAIADGRLRNGYDTKGLISSNQDSNTYWSVEEMDRWDDSPTGGAHSDFDYESWDAPNIARAYDYVVDTLAERDALLTANTLEVGDLVRVMGDSSTDNFWTLWRANTSLTGFTLVQIQRWNTTDCWSYIDWYADGVIAPLVVYPNIQARNNAFDLDPSITYVKVLDDGSGRWMWNLYQDGIWNVVAKQNGTIKLNDNVWNTSGNPVLAIPPTLTSVVTTIPADVQTQIAVRDRGYELNYLLNSLRDNIFTNEELNAVFFSMIDYVHTEQNSIDWCFKTSFMYVTGFNETLRQNPIQNTDFTSNLLDYVNEVKPYHVKIRDFISKYATPLDVANVSVMDFDKPMYFDKATNSYRLLDPLVSTDVPILQTGIWKNWYNQYLTGDSLARKLNLTSKYFDEISLATSGSVRIRVDQRAGMGASETSSTLIGDGTTAFTAVSTILPIIVPSQDAIMVFDNGVRINPQDVTFEPFTSTVEWTKDNPSTTQVEVAAWGYGANGLIRDTFYFEKKNGENIFTLPYNITRSEIFITLSGTVLREDDPQDATYVQVAGDQITINAALPNGLVQIAVMDQLNTNVVDVETFTWTPDQLTGQTFATLYPEILDNAKWPVSENFVFEISGIRRSIETAYNINITESNRVLRLDVDADISNLKARFNDSFVQIGSDLRRSFTLTKATRCVEIGVDTTADQITVTDSNGNPLIVGEIISSYPFPEVEIDPFNVPLAFTQTLIWENNNLVVWEDVLDQDWEHFGDEPSIRTLPENCDVVLWKDYLMSFREIPQDRDLVVRFKDVIPTDFRNWDWTPANAPVVKINDALVITNKDYGLLTVVDSSPAHRDISINDDILTSVPSATFVTITDLKDSELLGSRNHSFVSYGQDEFPISNLPFNSSAAWINLNDKRLVEGKDYEIIDTLDNGFDMYGTFEDEWQSTRYRFRGLIHEQMNNGWSANLFDSITWDAGVTQYDISAWDSDLWDVYGESLRTCAVKIFAGTNPGDIITATIFSGIQASEAKVFERFISDSEQEESTGNHGVYHDIPLSSMYTLISNDLVVEDETASMTIRQNTSPRMFAPQDAAFGELVWIEGESVTPGVVDIDEMSISDIEATMNTVLRGQNITSKMAHESGARVVLAYSNPTT